MRDWTDTTFPFFWIAKNYGVPYGTVLRLAQEVEQEANPWLTAQLAAASAVLPMALPPVRAAVIVAVRREHMRRVYDR